MSVPTREAAPAAPTGKTAAPGQRSLFLRVFPSIMLPMFLAVIDQTIVATALPAIAASYLMGEIVNLKERIAGSEIPTISSSRQPEPQLCPTRTDN
jgi:hypothetical protein